jgi:hypothetical protein
MLTKCLTRAAASDRETPSTPKGAGDSAVKSRSKEEEPRIQSSSALRESQKGNKGSSSKARSMSFLSPDHFAVFLLLLDCADVYRVLSLFLFGGAVRARG